jgi:ketosteroid isomerase-like protein
MRRKYPFAPSREVFCRRAAGATKLARKRKSERDSDCYIALANSGGKSIMRNQILFLLVFLLSVSICPLVFSQGSQQQVDSDAIRAHIESVFDAYAQHDKAKLRETHMQNWRGFVRPSREIIRGIDAYMQQADMILSGTYKVTGHKIVDFDVIFYGNVGLVSYIANLDWAIDGITYHDKLRVLDVYVKENGHWNQAGSQVATHPDALEAGRQTLQVLTPSQYKQLLETREGVWRSWFNADQAALEKVIPAEVIAINPAEEEWSDRAAVLASSKQFAGGGIKLVKLEFPKTKVQVYGDTAILYSQYLYETDASGKREAFGGRATEIFVRRDGVWVNAGWHMDSGK